MNDNFPNDIGSRVYGVAAIVLGLAGLAWADFALVWQPVPAGIPGRTMLACLTGALLVAGGAAMNWRRFAAIGAATLTILYALGVALLHLPLVFANPVSIGPWGGVAEQMALVSGGLIAYAARANLGELRKAILAQVGRTTFGFCALMFGVVHFRYANATAAMVPHYLPPNQIFWAYATGAAHIAAGLAILSGRHARLAAILLTAMFVVFGVLVHAPLLIADPTSHLNWVMNAMNLALTGAAWIVADSLALQK